MPLGLGTKDGHHSIQAEITTDRLYPTCKPGLIIYADLNKCMNLNPLLMWVCCVLGTDVQPRPSILLWERQDGHVLRATLVTQVRGVLTWRQWKALKDRANLSSLCVGRGTRSCNAIKLFLLNSQSLTQKTGLKLLGASHHFASISSGWRMTDTCHHTWSNLLCRNNFQLPTLTQINTYCVTYGKLFHRFQSQFIQLEYEGRYFIWQYENVSNICEMFWLLFYYSKSFSILSVFVLRLKEF